MEHILQWKVLGKCIANLVAIRRSRVLTAVLQSHADNQRSHRRFLKDEPSLGVAQEKNNFTLGASVKPSSMFNFPSNVQLLRNPFILSRVRSHLEEARNTTNAIQ